MARVKQLRKSRLAGVVVLAFCMTGGSVPYAFALTLEPGGSPDVSVFAHAQEIPDSALSHMRGRGILNGQLVQFGIEMFSKWRTDNGNRLSAGATMVVNHLNGTPQVSFQPHLSFSTDGTISPSPGGATQSAQGGDGIQNVNGVGQSIQIAGNSNSISNSANLTVTADPVTTAPGSGNQGSQTISGPGNSTLSATLDNGGMGVSISTPQGQAMQQIRGNSFGHTNVTGLVQMVQATGNMQQIENVMNLRVQLQSLASLTQQSNFNQTLNTLRGLSR